MTHRRPAPGRGQVLLLLALVLAGCERGERLDVASPWFPVREDQLALYASYSGWDAQAQTRFSHTAIGPAALQMIEQAQSVILVSVFLFDNFYAPQPPQWDVVEALTRALVEKKRTHPDLVVALVLDPSNRAYNDRIAPAVARLSAAGVDVFYSDLLSTRAHTPLGLVEAAHHVGRLASQATSGFLGWAFKSLYGAVPLPFTEPMDGTRLSLQSLFNAGLIKANHRKILSCDGPEGFRALISSANPHNASVGSTNYAVSVEGPLARYIFDVQRSDIEQSIRLRSPDYTLWHAGADRRYRQHYLSRTLPDFERKQLAALPPPEDAVARARLLTENQIERAAIEVLDAVQPGDRVRLQMFYLSDRHVLDALLRAARRVRQPLQLLLDPSKDAFGKTKDGTPNRQVAALLMDHLAPEDLRRIDRWLPGHIEDGRLLPLNLELRWFDTHGEQNHAKIISVTNPDSGKYVLLQGSANWTGKNLDNINMEANIEVEGAPELVRDFNGWFDRFYDNAEGEHYSVAYEHPEYSRHSGVQRWLAGERWGFVSW